MLDAGGGLEYLVENIIVNALEYNKGDVTDFAEVGVKATDEHTVVYTLCQPTSYFITMLGYNVFAPMSRTYFESKGGVFGKDDYKTAVDAGTVKYGQTVNDIAYCGPYTVTNHTANNTIVFKANPTYWNKDNITIMSTNATRSTGILVLFTSMLVNGRICVGKLAQSTSTRLYTLHHEIQGGTGRKR